MATRAVATLTSTPLLLPRMVDHQHLKMDEHFHLFVDESIKFPLLLLASYRNPTLSHSLQYTCTDFFLFYLSLSLLQPVVLHSVSPKLFSSSVQLVYSSFYIPSVFPFPHLFVQL